MSSSVPVSIDIANRLPSESNAILSAATLAICKKMDATADRRYGQSPEKACFTCCRIEEWFACKLLVDRWRCSISVRYYLQNGLFFVEFEPVNVPEC